MIVPPSGGSLEIGNYRPPSDTTSRWFVPPSGGSLEIGNSVAHEGHGHPPSVFPLRGDP